MGRGFFIAFEGPDGSGKTTAIKNLSTWLCKEFGIVPVLVKEPGSTPIGEKIKDLIFGEEEMNPRTEALLFQASRAALVEKIRILLLEGHMVITDRWGESSIAYQGVGRELGVDTIKNLNEFSTQGVTPDLTILMLIDPEVALERKRNGKKLDRIDSEDLSFHRKVERGYVMRAKEEMLDKRNNSWVVITAEESPEKINKAIEEVVRERLQERGFIEKEIKGKER